MAKPCSICNSPDGAAIDELLDAGMTQKAVADQFGLSKGSISRHARHAKQQVEGNDSETEISKWLSRADDQYLLAVANADQRGAVQSLVAGLRAVEAKVKSDERAFEKEQEQGGNVPPITVEQYDELTRKAEEAAAARGDDCMLIDRVTRFIGHRLLFWPDECRCDLILQFLEAEKTGAAVLWEFQQFIAKRTAVETPELAIHGGN